MRTERDVVVADMLYPRLAAPDLGEMEEFLTALGMVKVERTSTKLFMRGTGTSHHLYVAELGDPRFLGIAFGVDDPEALERLAARPGSSGVHELDEPGGGQRVTLTDPNGYQAEVVYGQAEHDPIDVPELLTNSAGEPERRIGRGPWGPDRPAHIKRFGHAVLKSEVFEETLAFYEEGLGLARSDEGVNAEGELDGVFLRISAGERYVDHHAIQLARVPQTGLHHVSYEVHNWSEVFEGAAYLARIGKYRQWGAPMRHYVGGQVGVYFSDPWGRIHEFWSDGDRVNDDHVVEQWTMEKMMDGPTWVEPDIEFFMQVCP